MKALFTVNSNIFVLILMYFQSYRRIYDAKICILTLRSESTESKIMKKLKVVVYLDTAGKLINYSIRVNLKKPFYVRYNFTMWWLA